MRLVTQCVTFSKQKPKKLSFDNKILKNKKAYRFDFYAQYSRDVEHESLFY